MRVGLLALRPKHLSHHQHVRVTAVGFRYDDPARPPIPDYSRYSYPLVYGESQVFPAHLDYGWRSGLIWRRVGHNLAPSAARPEPAALTVMIWEGTGVSAADLHAAQAIVGSVRVSLDA